jgi:hypothetical protein
MAETELREKIVIDGAEAGAARLNGLAAAAGRVAGAFHGIGELAAVAGGIAGMWGIAEAVRDVDHLYQAIMRVQDMTGMAADRAHAMFDMFELSGVEMEQAEKIITSMTRKGQQLADGMLGVGANTQVLTQLYQRLGITMRAGPEERILAMSKAAQEGKLDVAHLISAFMIPRSQAAAMMSMLKQGPERLKQIQQETLTGADVIDDRTLQSYRTMLQARRELKDAWGDLVNVFYKSLLPAITVILRGIKAGFDSIAPIAATIGKGLSEHMTAVVALTKTYVALLLTAKAINMFSDNKLGIMGRGKQLFSGAMGVVGRPAARAASMDFFAARAAAPGIGMFETVGGPLARIVGTVAGRIGLIGVVITVLVVAFKMLRDNVWGIGTAFKNTFGAIWSSLSGAVMKLLGVLKLLWSAIEPIVKLLAVSLLLQLLWLAKGLQLIAFVIGKVVDALIYVINAIIRLINKIPGVNIAQVGEAQKAAEQAADAKPGGDKAGAPIYQDFRGSKFEITNNFPEGIDGGRVAVATADELAALGERRLESGLRPLFSYR